MAAFVVGLPSYENLAFAGRRVSIFPGSATPAVVAAGAPFWIGYGFVPDGDGPDPLGPATRFELDVDEAPVAVDADVQLEDDRVVSKLCVATFGSGLNAGWHRFVGRWYDAGALTLTSDRWIEFVER